MQASIRVRCPWCEATGRRSGGRRLCRSSRFSTPVWCRWFRECLGCRRCADPRRHRPQRRPGASGRCIPRADVSTSPAEPLSLLAPAPSARPPTAASLSRCCTGRPLSRGGGASGRPVRPPCACRTEFRGRGGHPDYQSRLAVAHGTGRSPGCRETPATGRGFSSGWVSESRQEGARCVRTVNSKPRLRLVRRDRQVPLADRTTPHTGRVRWR